MKPPSPTQDVLATCRGILAEKSKSFRLAARLLPADCRDDAAIVYAWCRRADDAVDERPPAEQAAAVASLRAELDLLYSGATPDDPVVAAFADVVRRRHIPRVYADELLEGMAMDQRGDTYATMDDLYRYCFRVAGTVGLMMCHVMGVTSAGARRHAAHLGMGMQLTNICRDVAEDWERGRMYLPAALLADAKAGHALTAPGRPLPDTARAALAPVLRRLLADAERFYRSGERGFTALGFRAALAVDAARRVYGAIGDELARRRHDVLAGRAVVSTGRKLWLLAGCVVRALWRAPARWRRLEARAPHLLNPSPERSDDFLRP